MDKYNKAKEILEKYNQAHILKVLDRLDGEKKEELLEQILSINFDELKQLCKKPEKKIVIDFKDIEPVTAINKEKLEHDELNKYTKLGEDIVKNGKFAVATMAGGQGTRLGHHGPKGTFKINVEEDGKYLFEIIIDNLKRANEKYNVVIPWYIMTSKQNHMETLGFLEEKKYFGYPKDKVTLFKQDEFPFVDENRKSASRRRLFNKRSGRR